MTVSVNHYLTLYPKNNMSSINENDLKTLCFKGLEEKSWGFGSKRIGVQIHRTITDKISFSGFGYKTEIGVLYIGIRMWLDDGDYTKYVVYDPRLIINQHFIELIRQFQQQYSNLC
jgi:hypothetical protein